MSEGNEQGTRLRCFLAVVVKNVQDDERILVKTIAKRKGTQSIFCMWREAMLCDNAVDEERRRSGAILAVLEFMWPIKSHHK